MDQLLDKIHDIKTISHGHTLAPLNSVLEQPRFHQTSQMNAMQSAAQSILVPYMESVNNLLQQAMPLTRSINLTALRGMYNVKAISSPSTFDNDYAKPMLSIHNHERLDCLVYMIRSNRREWFMRLLALEMMTLGHDSARQDYEALLAIVDEMMVDMEKQTKSVVEKMAAVLKSDLFIGTLDTPDESEVDQQSLAMSNKLAILEKHVRNLQTKIVLCRHDAGGNGSFFKNINDRFGSMDQDISHILDQWEESKLYLYQMINNEQGKSTPGPSLPSPPSSPNSTISKRASLRRSYTMATNADIVKTTSTCLSVAPQVTQVPSEAPLLSLATPASHTSPSDNSIQSPQLSDVSRLLILQSLSSTPPPVSSSQLKSFLHDSPIPSSSNVPADGSALAPIPLINSKQHHLDLTTVESTLSSRRSWITEASVASFIESRHVYKVQAEQDGVIDSQKLASSKESLRNDPRTAIPIAPTPVRLTSDWISLADL